MTKYKSLSFNIIGMHCTACSNRLEKKLGTLKGIYKNSVNFASNTALIQYDPSLIKEEDIISIGNSLGFSMSPTNNDDIYENTTKREIFHVILAWVFTLLFFIPMFFITDFSSLIFGLVLAGLTILIPGFSIIKSAFTSIYSGILGMDVLIALGAISSWFSALLPFIGIEIPNYSMTATMLIAVNLTGKLLETLARGSASKAVNVLANFNGKYACKVLENGATEDILITELKIGDIIQVKSGEKIPTDGTILSGRTSTDESFLTGESLPIEKQEGDYVYGGAINIDGLITISVERDSKNNILAQTIKLIQEAQGSKIPIQILVDKITSIFVPIILTISFLCFAMWFAFPDLFPQLLNSFGVTIIQHSRLSAAISAAISVLVIACPCALGLATPMALVNGATLSASKGILIRKGEVVQNLSDINIIALDKTGTLTIGKPELTAFFHENIDQQEALAILSGLEQSSTHPLASAIIQHVKTKNITPLSLENLSVIVGQGITGEIHDTKWFAGSLKSTEEQSFTISEKLRGYIDNQLAKGETLVCLSNVQTKVCMAISSFSDTLTPDAKESILQLKAMNKKIIIITGDHTNAAQNIAKQLDVESVIAECSPKQKLDIIRSLQQQNNKVCFVGDGINDAAGLEMADVGIAIGTGTDVAMESGDIILITGSLTSLVMSFKVAKAIFLKIKQNLFWAFCYNIIAIPMAFMGTMSPIIAEIFMMLSSLIVIGNSVLLTYKKI